MNFTLWFGSTSLFLPMNYTVYTWKILAASLTYLHEIRFLVEVGRAHGREGDPLQLVEAPPLVEDVAQPLEQRELVGQRNLRVLDQSCDSA